MTEPLESNKVWPVVQQKKLTLLVGSFKVGVCSLLETMDYRWFQIIFKAWRVLHIFLHIFKTLLPQKKSLGPIFRTQDMFLFPIKLVKLLGCLKLIQTGSPWNLFLQDFHGLHLEETSKFRVPFQYPQKIGRIFRPVFFLVGFRYLGLIYLFFGRENLTIQFSGIARSPFFLRCPHFAINGVDGVDTHLWWLQHGFHRDPIICFTYKRFNIC